MKRTAAKDFRKDLFKFLQMLEKGERFAFSRIGDGELGVINGQRVQVSLNEWDYLPDDPEANRSRQLLINACQYSAPGYYVGIACPCCVGEEKYLQMKQVTGLPEERLTWANLFVNGNYTLFLQGYLPVFQKRQIVVVANESADITKLPFSVSRSYTVGRDAWKKDLGLIDKMIADIVTHQLTNHVYLISAGVLSNIMIHRLWQTSQVNTYIDIGSVFNAMWGVGANRHYLKGSDQLLKICQW